VEAIEPGQDWEVVIDFRPGETLNLPAFYERLDAFGTSIQVGEGDGMYRMHIHVPDKTEFEPIEYIRTLGTITNISIENLMVQLEQLDMEVEIEAIEPDQIAAVAVAPGYGIARIFASLGVAAIIEGGQTMNPSTKEILHAFENLPTDQIVILPNNKNILLAAQQAAEHSAKDVAVIPSVSVPQGISAMFCLDRDGDFDHIISGMMESLEEILTAELTTATRSV
jgi:dihydroxyacetone kinase-like predicted kinase